MKRILLPFLFLASAVSAHPEQVVIRHPQADVNYYCQRGYSIDQCVEIACSYATEYSCRIIGQVQNTYYIETYVPPTYVRPVVVVAPPPPVVYFPPIISVFSHSHSYGCGHRVYHRPRRR